MSGFVVDALQMITTGVVIISHLAFMAMEMFFWKRPLVKKLFGMNTEKAELTQVLAGNMGLYNGFLAAGLLWSLWMQKQDVLMFFLACVVIAGVYGGLTAKRSIVLVQGLPAMIALILTYYTNT